MTDITVTFERPSAIRVQDGSERTHSDYGRVTFNRRDYHFHAVRTYYRQNTPWVTKGTHYSVELARNGRTVRWDALTCVRDEVIAAFKERIQALNVEDNRKRQQELIAAHEAAQAELKAKLGHDEYWGNRLTPAEAKAEAGRIYRDLRGLADRLGHLDPSIAHEVNRARSALFAAWSQLRAAEAEYEATASSRREFPSTEA